MEDLSINELLWLSMEAKGKCPFCGSDITIGPKTISYRMGVVEHLPDGTTKETPAAYITDCENCGKMIEVVFSAKLNKPMNQGE